MEIMTVERKRNKSFKVTVRIILKVYIMKNRKNITKHSNDVETAEIKSLLKTLSETLYHEAVTSLGLTPMLAAVINAQEEYDQVESKARASKSAKEVGKTR